MNYTKRLEVPCNVMNAIQKIFACKNFNEELICFKNNYDDLKECKFFIYSDEEGVYFPEVLRTNNDNDYAIIEIGFSDKYYALDTKIYEDMLIGGEAKYNLDICVELDTQVVSYLKKIFLNKEKVDMPIAKKNLFYYLAREDVNYSNLLYMIENANKITSTNFQDCYLNLKSYEHFKHFDFMRYVDKNEIYFRADESNMCVNVDTTFNNLKSDEFKKQMKFYYDMYENIYCLLMKAVLIEMSNSQKSADNKMKMLVKFVIDEFGVFCERELAICYYYFEHHPKTERFFKRVKNNNPKIIDDIKGMAWDLAHIRNIEKLYDFLPDKTVKFGIHPILTFDNGLKDILMLYPVKKIAIYKNTMFPHFKYAFPFEVNYLFEKEVTEKRKEIFENRNIKELIHTLESEINTVIKKC